MVVVYTHVTISAPNIKELEHNEKDIDYFYRNFNFMEKTRN